MSEVFEGYERQYCDLSANLLRKCTVACALDGGTKIKNVYFSSIFAIPITCLLKDHLFSLPLCCLQREVYELIIFTRSKSVKTRGK